MIIIVVVGIMPLFIMIDLYMELDITLGPYYNCVLYETIHPNVDTVFCLPLNFDRSSSPKLKDCMVKVHVSII